MVSPFFFIALTTAANMVRQEQEELASGQVVKKAEDSDGLKDFELKTLEEAEELNDVSGDVAEVKQTSKSQIQPRFYRLPGFFMKDRYNLIPVNHMLI